MAVKPNASKQKVTLANPINPLTGKEFIAPEEAVVSVKNFNLLLTTAPRFSRNGTEVPGAVVLSIQMGTKSSMKEPIAFNKEILELEEAIEGFPGGSMEAFLEVLSISVLSKGIDGREKVVAPIGALRPVLGLE